MAEDIPNTYRFFIPPESIIKDSVIIEDVGLAHQLGRVLRLKAGTRVVMLDGQGSAYIVKLMEIGRKQVVGHIERHEAAQGDPSLNLTLYMPLIRYERLELVLQKGTELGASAFVPVSWQRSLPAEQVNERRLDRWQRIVREAAEQSGRGRLPDVLPPLSLEEACQQAATADLSLILWEGQPTPDAPDLRALLHALAAREQPAAPHTPTIAVLSGPEGGITSDELTTATERGIMPVSLGIRRLRAETAPIAAAAIIFYELEDDTDNSC
jgi:16S rRNA (uracil1498-N3)-methyltransferase